MVAVHLPPLRERAGDVALLARHLVTTLATRHRVPVPELTAAALAALERHTWPGNVRELRNVLERAVVVRGGEVIRPEDLALGGAQVPPVQAGSAAVPLDREVREREAVLEALRRAGGNRDEAAALLGVSVRTLYYRLRRFGIS